MVSPSLSSAFCRLDTMTIDRSESSDGAYRFVEGVMIGVGCVEFDGFRVGVFALRLVAQVAYGLLVEVRVASVDEVEGRCCGWFRHSIQSSLYRWTRFIRSISWF